MFQWGTRSTGTEPGAPFMPPTHSILPPVKDGPDAGAVRAVAVHVQPRGQQDPILHSYGAVGEGGDEELIPPCRENNRKAVGQSHASSWCGNQPHHCPGTVDTVLRCMASVAQYLQEQHCSIGIPHGHDRVLETSLRLICYQRGMAPLQPSRVPDLPSPDIRNTDLYSRAKNSPFNLVFHLFSFPFPGWKSHASTSSTSPPSTVMCLFSLTAINTRSTSAVFTYSCSDGLCH